MTVIAYNDAGTGPTSSEVIQQTGEAGKSELTLMSDCKNSNFSNQLVTDNNVVIVSNIFNRPTMNVIL